MSCIDVPSSEIAGCEVLAAAERHCGERGVILLVEDEALVRKVTCEVLQSAGYRVLKAKNSAEAVRTFMQYGAEVDLLLTDVIMPGRNGHELAHRLREICSGLRTILTSGYPETSIPGIQPHEAGVFYLPKPYSAQSLILKVQEALAEEFQPAAVAELAKRAACNG